MFCLCPGTPVNFDHLLAPGGESSISARSTGWSPLHSIVSTTVSLPACQYSVLTSAVFIAVDLSATYLLSSHLQSPCTLFSSKICQISLCLSESCFWVLTLTNRARFQFEYWNNWSFYPITWTGKYSMPFVVLVDFDLLSCLSTPILFRAWDDKIKTFF